MKRAKWYRNISTNLNFKNSLVIIRKLCELTWLFCWAMNEKQKLAIRQQKNRMSKSIKQRGGKAQRVCGEKPSVQHIEPMARSSEKKGGEAGGKGVPRRMNSVREQLGQDRESAGKKGSRPSL